VARSSTPTRSSRPCGNRLVLVGSDARRHRRSQRPADIGRLIASKRLAIANPDRDVAGARALDLLRKLGITVDDSNKAVAVAESSAGVVSLLSANKAQLGIVYATDALSGFKLVYPANAGSTAGRLRGCAGS
jgi:ABC-type molybdate transport system substrate-binding protein